LIDKYDITSNQFNILRILRGQYPNPATINLLKDRMLDKMSDASRLVERLRKKGLVKRDLKPNDRRCVDVIISEKGLKLLSEIDKLNDQHDAMLKKLNVKEVKKINSLLDKLRG
jgi:DNA-binding MarR family transcriptional regulator